MAHNSERRDVVGDGYYRGELPPQNESTPHPFFPEHERAYAPPYTGGMREVAPTLGPHCTDCAPQSSAAPALHSSIQEQRYRDDVPFNLRLNTQNNVPFAGPTMASPPFSSWNAAVPYTNQNQYTGTMHLGAAYDQRQDLGDRIPAGDDLQGRYPATTDFRRAYAAGFGPTPGTTSAEAYGHPYFPPIAGPSSGNLQFFAQNYVLDPGTRVDAIHMGTGGYGRLKIIITLEAVDGGV